MSLEQAVILGVIVLVFFYLYWRVERGKQRIAEQAAAAERERIIADHRESFPDNTGHSEGDNLGMCAVCWWVTIEGLDLDGLNLDG